MSLSIDTRECTRFHFTGILGSGMSAIAQFLRWEGCHVSGSDRSLDSPDTAAVRTHLEKCGCVLGAQDGVLVREEIAPDIVVVSTAIENDNPDIAAARERAIPVCHRSDILAALVRARTTVAVAGTSGKSTVTAMVFDILDGCGRSPSVISGANLVSLATRGVLGNAWKGSSDLLVIEADESDGTLVKYHPHLALILNVSKDHKSVSETMAMFRQLATQSKVTVVNADDSECAAIPHQASFGISKGDWRPDSVIRTVPAIAFERAGVGFTMSHAGDHNLANALAALCACEQLGCNVLTMAPALVRAGRVARRFERYDSARGAIVIDDFAHNPAKIEAALRTAQSMAPRVFAVFQPHGFGPTRFMKEELAEVFARVPRADDHCAILPIFYAGGTAQKDISSTDIAQRSASLGHAVHAPASRDELVESIRGWAGPGDVVLLMGARDPSLPAFAHLVASALN